MAQNTNKKGLHNLIGVSKQMQALYGMIEKVANSDSTVLLYGESGTGKELVARAIHQLSDRSKRNFVPVNCGAIPKDLLESELFGHEKGAFTGAVNTRIGRFELADCGTILLDEIAELHPSLQVKLLRVLQEKEFERVGGTKTIKVDARIVAATNKNLEERSTNGKFREDLFYRLNVIPLRLPLLRDRKDDILITIDHFMNTFCKKRNRIPLKFTDSATTLLLDYPWPGNVRELEALIERLVILTENNTITPEDLPERFTNTYKNCAANTVINQNLYNTLKLPDEGIDLNSFLENIETTLIKQAMDKADGIKSKAASLLGLNRTTFLEKLKKRGLDPKLTDKPIF
ncbi:two component, sigma54 specific, Fis family transcriptional regulator [Candidatus Magnetoovum chiemensis]|nr:two component, sigma54 specific, Fis family transcriptional regulator [Candidatus Magnetoovum chiemensis]